MSSNGERDQVVMCRGSHFKVPGLYSRLIYRCLYAGILRLTVAWALSYRSIPVGLDEVVFNPHPSGTLAEGTHDRGRCLVLSQGEE